MLRRSAFAKALWLLAIAVLAVRVGDAHLHFCADGREQAFALHVTDVPGQHHSDEAGNHEDRDLDISGPTFFKKVSGSDEVDLAPAIAIALVLLLPVIRQLAPADAATSTPYASTFLLRPPLRGPPL
ncbi:MAG TPA: hypothetical protein VJQ52_08005 [Steroidobacteraceae bacterium]|nr:hypothetical protein [Steroidobacteraceae bacterium]